MALTYSWQLTGLQKKSVGTLNDVIVGVRWTLTGTDEDNVSGKFEGSTPLNINSINPNTFIPYTDLTEENVLSWIQGSVNGYYKNHIDEMINSQIKAKKSPVIFVDDGKFPWNSN